MSHYPATTLESLQEMSVGAVLRATAERSTGSLALTEAAADGGRRWTYAELLDVAERVAVGSLDRFELNERDAVWRHNVPEWVMLSTRARSLASPS